MSDSLSSLLERPVTLKNITIGSHPTPTPFHLQNHCRNTSTSIVHITTPRWELLERGTLPKHCRSVVLLAKIHHLKPIFFLVFGLVIVHIILNWYWQAGESGLYQSSWYQRKRGEWSWRRASFLLEGSQELSQSVMTAACSTSRIK